MSSLFWKPAPPQVMTPCIGVCAMGEDGVCQGCFRTLAEITAWGSLGQAERQRIMDEVLPKREASRS